MVLDGTIVNGQIVLHQPQPPLPEGAKVKVEVISEPTLAFLLSRLVGPHFPECLGVFRSVQRPTHQELLDESFRQGAAPRALAALLAGDESWTVA